jgi:acyl carrier protein
MSPNEQIRDFLVSELGWEGPRSELTDHLPLIENQIIDSIGLLRLIGWLEPEFGIAIPDEDIVPANFATIGLIAELVAAKTADSQQR